MASQFFGKYTKALFDGNTDLSSSTVKCFLVNSTGNDGLSEAEIDDGSYVGDFNTSWRLQCDDATDAAAKVKTCDKSVTQVDAQNHVNIGTSETLTFTSISADSSPSAYGVLVYVSGTTEANSRIITYSAFSSKIDPDGGDVDVTFASGFARASYGPLN